MVMNPKVNKAQDYKGHKTLTKSIGKKPVDLKAPKKPMNSWLMYLAANREKVRKEYKLVDIRKIISKCAERWGEMPDEEKEPWIKNSITKYEA